MRVGGQIQHNSDPAALQDGQDQPQPTEANPKERRAERSAIVQSDAHVCKEALYSPTLVHTKLYSDAENLSRDAALVKEIDANA